jgi:hypothetical protein
MMASPQYEVIEADEDVAAGARVVAVYEKLGLLAGKSLRRVIGGWRVPSPTTCPTPCPSRSARASGSSDS